MFAAVVVAAAAGTPTIVPASRLPLTTRGPLIVSSVDGDREQDYLTVRRWDQYRDLQRIQ